jgi:uncharacterized repeat protein (TIGR03806 family)
MPYRHTFLLLLLLALTACGGGGGGGGGDSQSFGLDERATPSSVQIPTGAGNGAPLRAVNAFPNLQFNGPVVLTHPGDGSNRLFVAERSGAIKVFANSSGATQATTLLDLQARVDSEGGEAGFLGLAFDPNFRSNRTFYVSYATKGTSPRKVRLARYRVSSTNASAVEAGSERVLLEIDHANAYHFGGWIGFGPDGLLYMTHGDGGNESQVQSTSTLFGKVLRLRINSDASAYAVPTDNPYGNLVWARGLRNPWRCSFDRAGNGNLWCGDVGNSQREEVNLIRRDANYGWPIYEGSLSNLNPSNLPYGNFTPPVHEYDHTQGVAVIGGFVYRGAALPALAGRYVFGDFMAQSLWALPSDGNGGVASRETVASGPPFLLGMGEDQAGELYLLSGGGSILGLQANAAASAGAAMPATLSATGLFSNLAQLTPSPGVIDYEVNSPFWSDGARKQRWLVVPGGATIAFAADGAWSFPLGTITVKHFELPLPGGGTTRVETRVMVNRADGWTGYTYRWRADQSDADLVSGSGATAAYDTVNPATGAATRITWTFPSQTQCLACHTQATGRVLGVNTLQFNRDHTYQSTGNADNQLRTLNHIGLFSGDIGSASQYGEMPDPSSAQAPLESRAKAYLETNCSNCHRPGGPTSIDMDLRYGTAVAAMNVVGVAAGLPTTPGALRIAAGNPAASDVWRRATSTTSTRMPPLGTTLVDERGLQSLSAWIDSLR